jgi:TolB protein
MDGARIAFSSTPYIIVLNVDTLEERTLTNRSQVSENPAWSPDGNRLAFQANRDGGTNIYAVYADGSDQVALTKGNNSYYFPQYSPDGSKIAFYALNPRELWIMEGDGSGARRVSNNGKDGPLIWSPDGKRLAFQAGDDSGNYGISVMNADGSNIKRVTNGPAEYPTAWSPDATQIIGLKYAAPDQKEFQGYFTIAVDGSSRRSLPASARSVAWQPVYKP